MRFRLQFECSVSACAIFFLASRGNGVTQEVESPFTGSFKQLFKPTKVYMHKISQIKYTYIDTFKPQQHRLYRIFMNEKP